jgi:type I restriction enzyme S subunit
MKQGWEIKKLGEVCEISTGKSNTEDAIENGDFAFFDRSKIIKRSSKFLFDCDAIIVAGEGQTFLPKFYSGKFDLHQRAYAIYNFDKKVSIHYVYKYLIHFHKYFEIVAVGATAKSLRLRHFQDLPIPIPPLPEQQRIVSILDEAFAAIARAKANAERNLQNSKELFESYLQGVFENGNWEKKKIVDISTVFEDGDWIESKDQSAEGIRLIQTGNVGNGIFKDRGEKARYISENTFKKLRCTEIFEGDCLVSRLPDPVGRTCILPDTGEKMITAVDCTIIRFDQKQLTSNWFLYYSLSIQYQNEIQKQVTGATRQRISRKNLGLISVPIPQIKAQQTIVRQLDALRAETLKLEAVYQKKIDDLEELKKSILQMAFAGELKMKKAIVI